MNGPRQAIRVVPYDANWPFDFQTEALIISGVLGDEIMCTHHIGSTAVPGLQAKPIIDILLEVRSLSSLDAFDHQMEAIDYMPKGEFGIPERRFYMKGADQRTHHIHAFLFESAGAIRHLAFRDYLKAHPGIAKAYGELKAEIVRHCEQDIEQYCAGKHDFVAHHEAEALKWMNGL
jgi:GrpB-like predicted nucleotidyltransferase (UPF0157 family)